MRGTAARHECLLNLRKYMNLFSISVNLLFLVVLYWIIIIVAEFEIPRDVRSFVYLPLPAESDGQQHGGFLHDITDMMWTSAPLAASLLHQGRTVFAPVLRRSLDSPVSGCHASAAVHVAFGPRPPRSDHAVDNCRQKNSITSGQVTKNIIKLSIQSPYIHGKKWRVVCVIHGQRWA